MPLFVLDDAILASRSTGRTAPASCSSRSHDLDDALRALGGALVDPARRLGDEVADVARDVGADAVHVSDDVSGVRASRASTALADASCRGPASSAHPGITVVAARRDHARRRDGDHYKVFTPYYRRWLDVRRRARRARARPRSTLARPGSMPGALPALADLVDGDALARRRCPAARRRRTRRLDAWIESALRGYAEHHDDLPGDATSRLSPYLHFGCVSPLEVRARPTGITRARASTRSCGSSAGATSTSRSSPPRPDAAWSDYSTAGDRWHDDPDARQAWKEGRTGYPVVDAGMRQLAGRGLHAQPRAA